MNISKDMNFAPKCTTATSCIKFYSMPATLGGILNWLILIFQI